jgi:hypothetical protein
VLATQVHRIGPSSGTGETAATHHHQR